MAMSSDTFRQLKDRRRSRRQVCSLHCYLGHELLILVQRILDSLTPEVCSLIVTPKRCKISNSIIRRHIYQVFIDEIATSGIGEEHAVAFRLPLGEGEEDDERLQQLLRQQPVVGEEALARLQHERQFHDRRKSRGLRAEPRHRPALRRRPDAAAQVRALQKDQASA